MVFIYDDKGKEYKRAYYQKNKAAFIARNGLKRKRLAAMLKEYKESNPCTDCGKTYPAYVMDLDHLPGTKKLYAPNQLVNKLSWASAQREIAKCELVCSNCHRERTHARKLAAKAEACHTPPTTS